MHNYTLFYSIGSEPYKKVRMCSTNITEDIMPKNTSNDTSNKRKYVKGGPQPVSRTQEKRLTKQLMFSSSSTNRDHFDSEKNRFKPGDSERLRKAVM